MGKKENPYLTSILKEFEQLDEDWNILFDEKISINKILTLLATLVKCAESIITSPGSGKQKHDLVRDAFEYFDKKCNIIDSIDKAIPLPWFLEPFDGMVIEKVIDWGISMAVTVFNMTIWEDDGTTPEA